MIMLVQKLVEENSAVCITL